MRHASASCLVALLVASILVVVVAALPSELQPSEATYQHEASLGNGLRIWWTNYDMNSSRPAVEVLVRQKAKGWVAIGFGRYMVKSDCIIARAPNKGDGAVIVEDWFLEEREDDNQSDEKAGCPDNLLLRAGGKQNGEIWMQFLRYYSTGDAKCDREIETDGLTDVVFASGDLKGGGGGDDDDDDHKDEDDDDDDDDDDRRRQNSDPRIGYHGRSNYGLVKVDFPQGKVERRPAYKLAHAWLMFAAWGVLLPLGTFIARFLWRCKHWFQMHRAIQLVGLLVALAGLVLGVLSVAGHSRSHFYFTHGMMGLVLMAGAVLQPLLGILADRMYNPKRFRAPLFPDMIHWIVGYSLHLLAFATLVMGVLWYEAGKTWFIALLTWIGALVALFLILLLWRFIVGDTCCQVMPEQGQPLADMEDTPGGDVKN